MASGYNMPLCTTEVRSNPFSNSLPSPLDFQLDSFPVTIGVELLTFIKEPLDTEALEYAYVAHT